MDMLIGGRSVFIEWKDKEAAAEGIAALVKREDWDGMGFALNNISVFDGVYSVFFTLHGIDFLTEEGRAVEDAFIAAAEATGGEYTGS